MLAERWSPRHFDATAPLDEAALQNALEAARWAPSAFNSQPWRMVVARRGTVERAAILSTLGGFNQTWAGFDPDAAADALNIDRQFAPTTVMAVGSLGGPAEMSDAGRERETAPRARRAAAESVLVNA